MHLLAVVSVIVSTKTQKLYYMTTCVESESSPSSSSGGVSEMHLPFPVHSICTIIKLPTHGGWEGWGGEKLIEEVPEVKGKHALRRRYVQRVGKGGAFWVI